jgi:hypothetical protein
MRRKNSYSPLVVPGAVDLAAQRILLLVDLLVLGGSEFAAIGRAVGVDFVIDGRLSLFGSRRFAGRQSAGGDAVGGFLNIALSSVHPSNSPRAFRYP